MITDAIDNISKVLKTLDFLTSEIKNDGLCFILGNCQEDLENALECLKVAETPNES